MRLVSNPRLFTEPESVADAWEQVDAWLDADPVWLPAPTPRHREVLRDCIRQPGMRANDVPDAHLAALAVEHGLKLATSDRGFARFERLAWFDPLSPAYRPRPTAGTAQTSAALVLVAPTLPPRPREVDLHGVDICAVLTAGQQQQSGMNDQG